MNIKLFYIILTSTIVFFSCKNNSEKKLPSKDSPDLKKKVSNHNNGQIDESVHYLNDSVRHGLYESFYPNGKMDRNGYFYDNQMVGKWKFYDTLGHLQEVATYHDNALNGDDTTYFPSGQIEAYGKYVIGKEEGEWKFFHPNGQLKHRTIYVEGMEQINSYLSYDSTGRLTTDTTNRQ